MYKDYSTFERRMEIMHILMQQKQISRRELSRLFSVSEATIDNDIRAINRYAPTYSKMGRYGGICLVDGFKTTNSYFSDEETAVIEKLSHTLTGNDKNVVEAVLHKFTLPKK